MTLTLSGTQRWPHGVVLAHPGRAPPTGVHALSPIYSVQPSAGGEGGADGSPGRVTLRLDDGASIARLYMVDENGSISPLMTTVDLDGKTVSAVLPHGGDILAAAPWDANGGTQSQAGADPPDPQVPLDGRVVGTDGTTGIAGAEVLATSDGVTVSTRTNDDGDFSLPVDGRDWTISVDPRANYAAPSTVTVNPKHHPGPLTLTLGAPQSGEPGAHERTDLRTATSRTFVLGDGQFETVLSATPINYLGPDGKWRRLNTALVPVQDGDVAAQSGANSFEAQFHDDPSSGDLVDLTLPDNTGVSIGLDGAHSTTARLDDSGGLIYADALPGADLVYHLTASGVKEAISLAGPDGPTSYRFSVQATSDDLTPVQLSDGSWAFVHDSGEVAFRLERPSAVDATGASTQLGEGGIPTNPVALAVDQGPGGTFWVSVTLNHEWLADPRRVFPVFVDPTITLQPDSRDATYPSNDPTATPAAGPTLEVGGSKVAVVQFGLGQIPSGNITSAQLSMWWTGCSGTCASSGTISLHQLEAPWVVGTTTYGALTTPAPVSLSTTSVSGTSLLNSSTPIDLSIPTTTIEDWLSGAAPNYGLSLDATASYQFMSSSGTDPTKAPRLTITWQGDAPVLYQPSLVHSSGADLSWTQFSGTSGPPYVSTETSAQFARYEIRRSYDGGAMETIASITDPAIHSFVDSTAGPSRQFTYQIATITGTDVENLSNVVTVTTPADGHAIAIVQPPPSGADVTWVDGAASSTNYGAQSTVTVSGTGQALVRFDLRPIVSQATITSATLALYATSVQGTPGTITATRNDSDWAELGVTWNSQRPTTGGTSVTSSSVATQTWTTFDVTPMVQDWVNGTTTNYGVTIAGTGMGSSVVRWNSDDLPYGQALAPKLTIDFEDGSHAHGPQVAMGAPGPGNLISGTGVLVTAGATDDGRVASVDFLVDGSTPIGSTITSGPWQTTLDTSSLSAGVHTITASAIDNAGNVTTSTIDVTVASGAPSVTTPSVSGSGTGTVTISTTASDDVAVSRVEFYVDGSRIATDTSGPTWSASWDTLTSYDGTHVITVSAFDADGQVATSSSTTYTVSNTAGTGYRATITPTGTPGEITYDPSLGSQAGASVGVQVTNDATTTMSAATVSLRYEWISADATPTVVASGDVALGGDIAAGGSSTVSVDVLPPTLPAGAVRARYTLRFDLYDASTGTYFAAAGNAPAERAVSVNLATDRKLGTEGYYEYDPTDLGGGVTDAVNLATGDNIVQWTPFAEPGVGPDSTLTITYNSLENGSVSPAGNNVSLTISGLSAFGAPLDIDPNSSISLIEADGSRHTFTWDSGAGFWAAPAGDSLYLSQASTVDTSRWWAFTAPDRTTYYYDQAGYPTAVVDANGNTLSITQATVAAGEDAYGLAEHPTAVTDQMGRQFTIEYYGSSVTTPGSALATSTAMRGKIRTITDHVGEQLQFDYYEDGNLRRLTEVGGLNDDGSWTASRSLVFTYTNPAGTAAALTDPADREDPPASVVQSSKLFSVSDFLGHETTFTYETSGSDQWRLASRTDRAGAVTTFDYATNTTTVCRPLTDTGCPTSGRVWTYTFDSHGRVVSVLDPVNPDPSTVTWNDDTNTIAQITESSGRTTTYAYNDNGLLTDVWDSAGQHTSFTYENLAVDANDIAGKWQSGRSIPHISQLISKTEPAGNDGLPYFDGSTPLATWLGTPHESASSTGATVVNLATNPSFETDLTGWSASAGRFVTAGATQSRDTTTANVGSASLKVATTSSSAGQGSSATIAGTFLAGTTYTLTVRMKGQAGGEAVDLSFGDGTASSTDYVAQTFDLTTGWGTYAVVWTPKSDRTNVVVSAGGDGAAARTFWVDGVGVLAPEDPVGPVTNLVSNPSFETGLTGWTSSGNLLVPGATISQDATTASAGGKSMKLVTSQYFYGQGAKATITGTFHAGTAYTFTVRLKSAAATSGAVISVGQDLTGTKDIATGGGTFGTDWTTYTAVWVPQVTRTSAAIVVEPVGSTTVWVDAAGLFSGSETAYFDGDSTGATWSGAPHASPSVKPSEDGFTPSNLVGNGDFESSLGGWSSSAGFFTSAGATITSDTATAARGLSSMKVQTTSPSTGQGASTQIIGVFAAGQTYVTSVRLRGQSGGEVVRLDFGDEAAGSDDWASKLVTLTNTWATYTVTWTPSATSTATGLALRTESSGGVTYWADDVQTQLVPDSAYFDGDTPGYTWTNTPNASTSSDAIINHVPNPSFELADYDTGGYWTSEGTATITLATDQRFIGSKAAHVIASDDSGLAVSAVDLVAGRTYTASAWIFADADMTVGLRYGSDVVDTQVAAHTWTRVTRTFTYTSPDAAVAVLNTSGSSRTLLVDGVQIVDNANPSGGYTTRYGYDAAGNLVTITDPIGATTTATYGTDGLQTTERQPDTGDGIIRQTSFDSYDDNGNPTQVTDAAGGISRSTYDAAGRLISSQDPDHASFSGGNPADYTTRYVYDRFGRLVATSSPSSTGTFPGQLIWTHTAYDANGNVLVASNPQYGSGPSDDVPATTSAYDAMDRPTLVTSPTGDQTAREYDAAGRTIQVTKPKGVLTADISDDYATITTYDLLDRVVATTQKAYASDGTLAQTRVTRTCYDTAGDARWVMGPLDSASSCPAVSAPDDAVWDDTTGLQDTTVYTYDAVHRAVKQVDALGHASFVVYDANGQVLATIDQNGNLASNGYDARGDQVYGVTPFDPSTGRTVTSISEYDAIGNLTRSISSRAYDTAAEKNDIRAFVTRYSYDALDRAIRTEYAGGDYASEVLADRPWGYWRMDDATGNLTDASGNGNDLTVSSGVTRSQPGAIQGDDNLAAAFSNAYVYRAAAPLLNTSFTVELWANGASVSSTAQTLFANGQPGVNGIQLQVTSGNVYLVRDGTSTSLSATFGPSDGWAHLVLVDDNGSWSFYKNGQNTYSGSLANATTPSGNMLLGSSGASQSSFAGELDEVAVYSYALSAARVRAHSVIGRTGVGVSSYQHSAYDANGNALWTSLPTLSPTAAGVAASDKTTNTYYDTGAVMTAQGPTTPKTRFLYSAEGWQVMSAPETAMGSGVIDLNRQINSAYRPDGTLASTVDPLGLRSTYAYDADGNKTSLTEVLGLASSTTALPLTVTAEFDGFDHLTKVRIPEQTTTTPTSYWVTLFGYDLHGNSTTLVTGQEESPTGTVLSQGRTQSFTYDALDRPTLQTDDNATPSTSGDDQRLVSTYTADGLEASRTLSKSDGAGGWTVEQKVVSAYYANGLIKSQTTWSDDPDTNPSAPLISSHQLSYVDHGVYMDGNRVSDVFQLKGADSTKPCFSSTCTASWAYDGRDRLLREATGTGPNTTYVMDVYGQNTQEWATTATTSPVGVLTRSATYNGTQLASDTTNGVTQKYFYDSVGNLACVMTGDYTGSACPDADTVPTTLITRYSYDSKNRLVSMANYSAGSPTTSATYVLDALDRTLSRNEDNYGIDTRTDYVYIGLSNAIAQERAFGSTGPGGSDIRPESVHDAWGWGGSAADLTYAVADDNGATYDFSTGGAAYYVDWNLEDMGFDPGNGLSSLSVSLANTSDFGIDIQVVDASGNVVAHTGYTTTGGSLTYTPTTPLGPTAASDLRVRVVNDPVTWNALYARVNTVRVSWTSALINPSGLADLKSYSYDANGRPLTLTDSPAGEPTTSVSYVYDPSGSVAAIVDQNGAVKASYGYTAYGQSNLSLASNAHGIYPRANPVQYAGSQYDIATDTFNINDQRYSPNLERSLGAGSQSHTAGAQSPVNANRAALENPADSCLTTQSLACGSFSIGRLASNRALAERTTTARQGMTDTWLAALAAFRAQADAAWTDPNWSDADANHYFGYYWGQQRHLDPIAAAIDEAIGAVDTADAAGNWRTDPAVRAYLTDLYWMQIISELGPEEPLRQGVAVASLAVFHHLTDAVNEIKKVGQVALQTAQILPYAEYAASYYILRTSKRMHIPLPPLTHAGLIMLEGMGYGADEGINILRGKRLDDDARTDSILPNYAVELLGDPPWLYTYLPGLGRNKHTHKLHFDWSWGCTC